MTISRILILLGAAVQATAQIAGPAYSIDTPRPINPAANTTTPSAQAAQSQNPYLGSTPSGKATGETISLSLQGAIDRGLRYNLGLVETNRGSAAARAQRVRALAAMLPQISARGEQSFQRLSFKEIGIKLPPIPGFPGLPSASDPFSYQDARINASVSLYSRELRSRYTQQKSAEEASGLTVKDSRDIVVYAVGTAYFQVAGSAARVETAQAQLASAQEADRQLADQVKSEVSPEIDSIRAQVERQTSEQRLINARNAFEKDKLTLARVIGLPSEQSFSVSGGSSYAALPELTTEQATGEALASRSDLASAEATVRSAEAAVRAEKAQRLPVLGLNANYGAAGVNLGHMDQVYTVSGTVSVPLYTGGRIRADIDDAEAELERRRSEYEDLKSRIAYDVRVAMLDAQASESSVKVALSNQSLAGRALTQAEDRYGNGVTNYLEVIQAQEAVASAGENYVESLYSFNIAKIALARAMGLAEKRVQDFFQGK
jgi:outer membrane protein TolC